MSREVMMLFCIAFSLFLMQAIGGYFQIRDYKKAVKRIHKLGNVGIGQTKGGLFTGNLVLVACDNSGTITGAEVMEGMTFLAHFKPQEAYRGKVLAGSSIYTFLKEFSEYSSKEYKRNKGYIQAMEALALRLNGSQQGENLTGIRE